MAINLHIELDQAQAEGLTLLLLRIGWSDLKALSQDDGELEKMSDAIYVLRAAIARGQYAKPRDAQA